MPTVISKQLLAAKHMNIKMDRFARELVYKSSRDARIASLRSIIPLKS
jgi:hypothetical protein